MKNTLWKMAVIGLAFSISTFDHAQAATLKPCPTDSNKIFLSQSNPSKQVSGFTTYELAAPAGGADLEVLVGISGESGIDTLTRDSTRGFHGASGLESPKFSISGGFQVTICLR